MRTLKAPDRPECPDPSPKEACWLPPGSCSSSACSVSSVPSTPWRSPITISVGPCARGGSSRFSPANSCHSGWRSAGSSSVSCGGSGPSSTAPGRWVCSSQPSPGSASSRHRPNRGHRVSTRSPHGHVPQRRRSASPPIADPWRKLAGGQPEATSQTSSARACRARVAHGRGLLSVCARRLGGRPVDRAQGRDRVVPGRGPAARHRPLVHRRHRRFCRGSPGIVAGVDTQPPRVSARLRRSGHRRAGRGSLLRHLRPGEPQQNQGRLADRRSIDAGYAERSRELLPGGFSPRPGRPAGPRSW